MEQTEIKSPLSMLSNSLVNPLDTKGDVANVDNIEDDVDDGDGVVNLDPKPKAHESEGDGDEDEPENTSDSNSDDDETGDEEDENSDENGDSNSADNGDEDEETNGEDENGEVSQDESELVGDFFDVFAESLGVTVDKDNKPGDIDSLTDWVRDLIDENSKPEYSSEDVKNLDDFIKNGGNFEDYYKAAQDAINYDSVDLENEDSQKGIITEYLKKNGYSQTQIDKKLDRFEEAGLLEDEANDDLEHLKELNAQQKQQLLDNQEAAKKQQVKQQQEFYSNITNDINKLDTIKSVKIPKEDRSQLMNYLFKADANGQTQYQKDWSKNISKNLIESAYFMMKGDVLLKSASRSGETSAVSRLRNTLSKGSKGNRSQQAATNKQTIPIWDLASQINGQFKNN